MDSFSVFELRELLVGLGYKKNIVNNMSCDHLKKLLETEQAGILPSAPKVEAPLYCDVSSEIESESESESESENESEGEEEVENIPTFAYASAPPEKLAAKPEVKAESSSFPLPSGFQENVLALEGMGFKDRGHIIEVLINTQGKLDEALEVLAEERKKLVAQRKVEARNALLALLNSPFGNSVLDNMAELTLDGYEDHVENLHALLISDNNYVDAKKCLKENENE